MGRKSREKKEARERKSLMYGTMYGKVYGTGHSHNLAIKKGVFQVGTVTGRTSYNAGPVTWQTMPPVGNHHEDIKRKVATMQTTTTGMCGDCIQTLVIGEHDPKTHNRRKCQLCRHVWPGLEPDNNRRGAILEQRRRRKG